MVLTLESGNKDAATDSNNAVIMFVPAVLNVNFSTIWGTFPWLHIGNILRLTRVIRYFRRKWRGNVEWEVVNSGCVKIAFIYEKKTARNQDFE